MVAGNLEDSLVVRTLAGVAHILVAVGRRHSLVAAGSTLLRRALAVGDNVDGKGHNMDHNLAAGAAHSGSPFRHTSCQDQHKRGRHTFCLH